MNPTQIRALKQRFSGSYTDGQLLMHRLPNGLLIFTLDTQFASNLTSITPMPEIGTVIPAGDVFCKVNEVELRAPLHCTVVDANPSVQDQLAHFAAGPTTSFLIMVKQPPKTKFEAPENFTTLY